METTTFEKQIGKIAEDAALLVLDELAEKAVKTAVKRNVTKKINFKVATEGKTIDAGMQHGYFPLILRLLAAKDHQGHYLNIATTGPTGSGKTTLFIEAAKTLGQELELQPLSVMTSKADILGMFDATGNYIPSPTRRAFDHGGMIIYDEFDACHPGIATILNSIIGNRVCTFPDKTVHAHPDFRAVCCMNTCGHGGTEQYVGRNAQDEASLNRYFLQEIPYDEYLEAVLTSTNSVAQETMNVEKGGLIDAEDWVRKVRSVRSRVESENMRHVISPRASYYGIALIEQGVGKY